ncbi:MAG: hypothetical protein AAGD25_20070 [Cyanobacteria bacterium P01_F01_bin.150]
MTRMLGKSTQMVMGVPNQVNQHLETAPVQTKEIVHEAQRIESFFSKIMQLGGLSDESWDRCQDYPKLRQLNSLGRQIVIRMFRSNPRFQGYRVDFDRHMLNPDVLFLIGSLSSQFDYANTSPLFGLNILDIGCGALSEYAPLDKDANLLSQFYGDRPPVGAELLQMLGAKTIGVDPRSHCSQTYNYQTSYRHRMVEFDEMDQWIKDYVNSFDVVSCLNLLKRQSFLYGHSNADSITEFLTTVRRSLVSHGLLYMIAPLAPSSPENRQANRQIFSRAGLRVLHEGYYLIAEKM